MKKLVVLAIVLAFALSFAVTAFGQGDGNPWDERCNDRECYIDQGCAYDPDTGLYYCWYLKCCREQYFYKGECLWTDWECVSLI